MWELKVANEDVNVWRHFLETKQYDSATQYCRCIASAAAQPIEYCRVPPSTADRPAGGGGRSRRRVLKSTPE